MSDNTMEKDGFLEFCEFHLQKRDAADKLSILIKQIRNYPATRQQFAPSETSQSARRRAEHLGKCAADLSIGMENLPPAMKVRLQEYALQSGLTIETIKRLLEDLCNIAQDSYQDIMIDAPAGRPKDKLKELAIEQLRALYVEYNSPNERDGENDRDGELAFVNAVLKSFLGLSKTRKLPD